MPFFRIRVVNAQFESRDEGSEYPDMAMARRTAINAAFAIAVEEVQRGQTSAALEAIVEDEDGRPLGRTVIAFTVSDLHTPD